MLRKVHERLGRDGDGPSHLVRAQHLPPSFSFSRSISQSYEHLQILPLESDESITFRERSDVQESVAEEGKKERR